MRLQNLLLAWTVMNFFMAALVFLWPAEEGPHAAPAPAALSKERGAIAFAAHAGAFDQQRLPELALPPPAATIQTAAPEPGEELKRYRFIGLAVSEPRAAGVFARDGQTLVLTPGKGLAGFILISVDSAGARFGDEKGNEIRLLLETAPGQ